jgi:tight adherence protein B
MSLLLIVLFSFLSAVSLIVILFMLPMAVQDTAQARIKRRLTAIGKLDYASKSDIQSLLKSSIYSEIPWLNDRLSRIGFIRRIDLLLERANVDMTPGLFVLCCVGAGGVTFFLTSLLGQATIACMIFALIALCCPYVYLQFIIWKRLRKFLEQFPDGLDMIAQSLQAGLGLTQAMVFVAKEMPDPYGHRIFSLY